MHGQQTQSTGHRTGATLSPGRVMWVTTPADLACIYDDDVLAVVWHGAVAHLDDAVAALPSPAGRMVLDANACSLACLGHGSLLQVVKIFASLVDTTEVGVRWRTAQAPMCPQFHVDRVELRACLTLRGKGTELQVDDEIVATSAGDLVVMKGTLLDAGGCRHRSPPKETDVYRVVVTLDIVTSLQPPDSRR